MSNVTRSRGWILTQSADKIDLSDWIDLLESTGYAYAFQVEEGKQQDGEDVKPWVFEYNGQSVTGSGYLHYQAWIEHSEPIRFTTLKNRFPTAHLEPRKGKKHQAYEYVTKEDTRVMGPFENLKGMDINDQQGKRTDIAGLREMVAAGVSVSEIIRTEPSAARYVNYLDRLGYEINKEKASHFRDVRVTFIWGPTRSGKTSYIYNQHDLSDIYRVNDYTHPFDGYDGQAVLVLDEYRGGISEALMLNLLDRYPLDLPARYQNRPALFTYVYIVSNLNFSQIFGHLDQPTYDALQARVTTMMNITYEGVSGASKWSQKV